MESNNLGSINYAEGGYGAYAGASLQSIHTVHRQSVPGAVAIYLDLLNNWFAS